MNEKFWWLIFFQQELCITNQKNKTPRVLKWHILLIYNIVEKKILQRVPLFMLQLSLKRNFLRFIGLCVQKYPVEPVKMLRSLGTIPPMSLYQMGCGSHSRTGTMCMMPHVHAFPHPSSKQEVTYQNFSILLRTNQIIIQQMNRFWWYSWVPTFMEACS